MYSMTALWVRVIQCMFDNGVSFLCVHDSLRVRLHVPASVHSIGKNKYDMSSTLLKFSWHGHGHVVGSLKINTALEYSTRVVQEGDRRCKKSTLNDLAYLTPLRIPLMNPVMESSGSLENPVFGLNMHKVKIKSYIAIKRRRCTMHLYF
jgi:hypothetical protein